MALSFNWDLWGSGPPAKLTAPDTLRCIYSRGAKYVAVRAKGVWNENPQGPQDYVWLVVTGTPKEISKVDTQMLIDLVRIRYGSGI